MNRLPSPAALVTAILLALSASSVWSAEAAPEGKAATSTRAPATGTVQGWYPPPYGHGGYTQHWQQPAQQPGYQQPYTAPPYYYPYPPHNPNQASAPAAAAANADDPASAELKQARKQLADKSAELKKTRTSLAESRASLQKTRKQAKALGEQVADLSRERQALQARVKELTTDLKASLSAVEKHRQQLSIGQQMNRTLIADRARLRNDVTNLEFRLNRLLTDLEKPAETVQQAQSEPAACDQQLSDAMAQSAALRNELGEVRIRLDGRKTALAEAEQALAAATTERDGLQTGLASCNQELARTRAALKTSQSELETLRAKPQAAAGVAESAAMTDPDRDTDRDGVPDIIDLCPDNAPGVVVVPTGCVAGATIRLEGVNFHLDSSDLTREAQRNLDRIAGILNQLPELRLEVAGHTDASGDPSYNQWLSLQRAEAVMDYLVAQGVNPKRLGAAGYGGQEPLTTDTGSEAQWKNRRIELRPAQ